MRVAVTVEQCWHRVPGGTAVATIGLLRALAAHDDVETVGVAAWHRRVPDGEWRPPIPVAHLPLPRAALYETWHAPLLRFPKVERATGAVDVVHATAIAYPPADAPVVVTVHDLAFLHDPRRATRHGMRFFRRGTELALASSSLVACPSQASADHCVQIGFAPERVRVIPWGVEVEAVDEARVATARDAFGLGKRYVLFSGTVEPRKNLPRLLAAFADLRDRDAQLVLTGATGWNEDIGGALARLGDRVRPLGFVDRRDLDALVAGASVFAYPSLEEGFGLPVLEAMAHGAPVVTSSGTATAEVGGDVAVLVDPTDVGALTEAIDALLADPDERERRRAAGIARAATFTWQRAAESYVQLYRDALA